MKNLLDITTLDRITINPAVMGGKPCIRGMRVTVGMIAGLINSGYSVDEIVSLYPYLEDEDVRQSIAFTQSSSHLVRLKGNENVKENSRTDDN